MNQLTLYLLFLFSLLSTSAMSTELGIIRAQEMNFNSTNNLTGLSIAIPLRPSETYLKKSQVRLSFLKNTITDYQRHITDSRGIPRKINFNETKLCLLTGYSELTNVLKEETARIYLSSSLRTNICFLSNQNQLHKSESIYFEPAVSLGIKIEYVDLPTPINIHIEPNLNLNHSHDSKKLLTLIFNLSIKL